MREQQAATQVCEERPLRTALPANEKLFVWAPREQNLKTWTLGYYPKPEILFIPQVKDKAYNVNTARTSILQAH